MSTLKYSSLYNFIDMMLLIKKDRMYKSQHLEGLYDILQQEKTADTIYM